MAIIVLLASLLFIQSMIAVFEKRTGIRRPLFQKRTRIFLSSVFNHIRPIPTDTTAFTGKFPTPGFADVIHQSYVNSGVIAIGTALI